MTLVISALTSSGIVLTADSRQTYQNRAGAIRIGSDTAVKIFKLTPFCGVAISGKAFISENGKSVKDVGYFIKRFRSTQKLDGLTVKEIAEKLAVYLGDLFVATDTEGIKKQIKDEVAKKKGKKLRFDPSDSNLIPYTYEDAQGRKVSDRGWFETIVMIVAGVDKNDDIGRAYSVAIPKGITNDSNTENCGALWVGQTDVMMRIVKGYAPEIENLDFVKTALATDTAGTIGQLNNIEYIINWGTITLQDAVDFCALMTRTTENIQRFSDGTALNPGGIPGVGGDIDVAVITPEVGFKWLKRKNIRTSDTEISLDADEE